MRWPDCPYSILLITEEKDACIDGVNSLMLGKGMDWSTLLEKALDNIETPYLIFMLEDFFLRSSVDTGKIELLLELMIKNSFSMLRLIPRPGPDNGIDNIKVCGKIKASAPYKVSTQASIWQKKTLKKILQSGESAWEFEINGTERSRKIEGFVSVWSSALPYGHHVVERGKWFPWEAKRYEKMSIGCDFTKRSIMSLTETIKWLSLKVITSSYLYLWIKKLVGKS